MKERKQGNLEAGDVAAAADAAVAADGVCVCRRSTSMKSILSLLSEIEGSRCHFSP